MSPCKEISIPESGKFLNMESGIPLKIGIQNPTDKHWNSVPGIRNTAQGIRNPTKDWNPESKFHWQCLESGIHGVESRILESNPRLSWIPLHGAKIDGAQGFWKMQEIVYLRACLQEGRGPQVGEVTCGKSPHLTCKRDHIKMRDYMDGGLSHLSGLPHLPMVPHLHVNKPLDGDSCCSRCSLFVFFFLKRFNFGRAYNWKW